MFIRFRIAQRPKYRKVFRVRKEMAWKCCPGFQGSTCQEGKYPFSFSFFNQKIYFYSVLFPPSKFSFLTAISEFCLTVILHSKHHVLLSSITPCQRDLEYTKCIPYCPLPQRRVSWCDTKLYPLVEYHFGNTGNCEVVP